MSGMIISKAHRMVLVPTSAKIQAMWPQARALEHEGIKYSILPHDPRTAITMRAAGIEIPAPILHHYDWEGGQPFDVQKKTCALMTSNQRAYVLNDMGTGKTRAALWSWHYLNRTGCTGRLLVVAPLSTLKFTWLRECTVTLPKCKAVVLYGTRARRLELLKQDADIYIINHDGLKTIEPELFARKDIDCLVLDELACYRNRSQRTLRMRAFAARFGWVWGMSGRPMPNLPTDVWHQCKIVTPGRAGLPNSWRYARTALMYQINQFKWLPRSNAVETAYRWMQPAVRFSLDDVVELPPAISRALDVDLTEKQLKAYRKLSNDFAVMIEQKLITAANAGVALNKLLQVGGGYVYHNNPQYIIIDPPADDKPLPPRQQLLLDLIEEAEHKLIVFAPWRHQIDNLSALLTNNEIDHAVIHGNTKHREHIFSDFQNTSKYRLILAHPGCIHHGVTLTAATTIVWYSPVHSLEIYEQANARIRRVGQKHKQQFLHLQATSVERRIYAMLRSKQHLQDEFLQMIKQATGDDDDDKREEENSDD